MRGQETVRCSVRTDKITITQIQPKPGKFASFVSSVKIKWAGAREHAHSGARSSIIIGQIIHVQSSTVVQKCFPSLISSFWREEPQVSVTTLFTAAQSELSLSAVSGKSPAVWAVHLPRLPPHGVHGQDRTGHVSAPVPLISNEFPLPASLSASWLVCHPDMIRELECCDPEQEKIESCLCSKSSATVVL